MEQGATEPQIIAATARWIRHFVVGLNLCPFARAELERNRVNYSVVFNDSPVEVLEALEQVLDRLEIETEIETAFLIHPNACSDFHEYNNFLGDCDRLLKLMDLEGVYQIASFHPHYQFAGTNPGDAENYSNRSPYPMLHLLREASVTRALANYPNPEAIPVRNIATLEQKGADQLQALWQQCLNDE